MIVSLFCDHEFVKGRTQVGSIEIRSFHRHIRSRKARSADISIAEVRQASVWNGSNLFRPEGPTDVLESRKRELSEKIKRVSMPSLKRLGQN